MCAAVHCILLFRPLAKSAEIYFFLRNCPLAASQNGMLCDTLSAKSFRKDHTYSSPPPTAVDSAEQGAASKRVTHYSHGFFFLLPPFPLGNYTDTQGAFLLSLSFCPVINGACRGHVAKVRGPQETRSVFGCKNSKASWMHRNAPFTWLCQS